MKALIILAMLFIPTAYAGTVSGTSGRQFQIVGTNVPNRMFPLGSPSRITKGFVIQVPVGNDPVMIGGADLLGQGGVVINGGGSLGMDDLHGTDDHYDMSEVYIMGTDADSIYLLWTNDSQGFN